MGKRGRKAKDLTGLRFGRLVVIGPSDSLDHKHGLWECLCDCGRRVYVNGHNLGDSTNSCGCLQKESARNVLLKHGKSTTPEYGLWYAAKFRAKGKGLPFDLDPDDIVIPAVCPVLGIPIRVGVGVRFANSPSLDEFALGGGYVKSNVRVISWRANRLKSDMTLEEAQNLVEYLQGSRIEVEEAIANG
jgi:hypothetical protein